MIKAVLIDDERPALRELEYLLKDNGFIEICGMFTNPHEAINKIKDLDPQVVFLDINMPQLRGMDAASRIIDMCPYADIIFVTAYEQFAVEAFEIHALDYILKPVSRERFDKTLKRIINKMRAGTEQVRQKKFIIRTFGKFQVGWEGEEPIKWRTEKTKELFSFLLHFAGKEVSKDEIIDAVFYDIDIEKAVHHLHNGIYYIRKTFLEYGSDMSQLAIEGNYLLRLGEAQVDRIRFKQCLKQGIDECSFEALESAIALYDGNYFEGMDWAWAEPERERLGMIYMEALIKLAEMNISHEKFDRAEELLLNAFNRNPYEEEVSRTLLKLYKKTNKADRAFRHYRIYEKLMKEELGVAPGQDIVRLVKSL